MTEILMQYGLFLAKAATMLIVVWLLIVLFTFHSRRGRKLEVLEIEHLNTKYRDMALVIKQGVLPKDEFKKAVKAEKARLKLEKNPSERKSRKRVFVLNFHGDLKATAVSSLREEISALLSLATPEDEVLLRLENAGGLVHEHGLAASQLQRIRDRNIPLTIAVDKVAASGGYMMACVGNRILAAPLPYSVPSAFWRRFPISTGCSTSTASSLSRSRQVNSNEPSPCSARTQTRNVPRCRNRWMTCTPISRSSS